MDVRLEKGPFLKALQQQQGIVERKTTVPVLSHVLLKTKGKNQLEIAGTDLELTLEECVVANVLKEGGLTVPAQLLYEVIRKCPDGAEIELTFDEAQKQLIFKAGVSHFSLPYFEESQFPERSVYEWTHDMILTGMELRTLIDQTRFAMSQEEVRFSLNGLYLHVVGENLKAAATDAHRLALSWIPLPPKLEGLEGMILSRKTVGELRRLIEGEDQDIKVQFSGTQGVFRVGQRALYTRFINGTFPQYREAIPQEITCQLKLERKSFFEAVDRVSVVAIQEKTRPIKLLVEKGRMTFSSKGMEQGFATESISVDYDDAPFEISFNARYVMDVLQHIRGEHFSMQIKDSKSPVVMKDLSCENVLYVLMPVRLA